MQYLRKCSLSRPAPSCDLASLKVATYALSCLTLAQPCHCLMGEQSEGSYLPFRSFATSIISWFLARISTQGNAEGWAGRWEEVPSGRERAEGAFL